jgi:hypothetical protein
MLPLAISVETRSIKTKKKPKTRMPARTRVNRANAFIAPFQHTAQIALEVPEGDPFLVLWGNPGQEKRSRPLNMLRSDMLSAMVARPKSNPRALLLLGGVALLLAACSSDYPIRVTTAVPLGGAVVPTNILCNVSGGTTTATGHSTGPATVVLALTVQNATRQIVGTSPTITSEVQSGRTWNWTLRASTGASVPTGCIVNTVGSTRPTAIP